MSKPDKAYNATRAGQLAMAHDADKRAVAFQLNQKVKELGGESWGQSMIKTADSAMLVMIRDELIKDYNRLLKARQTLTDDKSEE